jgi:hypothetical protein
VELLPGRNEARLVVVDGRDAVQIELSQGKVATIDPEDWEVVRHHRWYAGRYRGVFYACRSIRTPNGNRTRFMHQSVIADAPEVDHVDRTKTLDNRRVNLRPASKSENGQNRGALARRRGRTTKYKGVYLDRHHGKFRAVISVNRKRVSLGYFGCPEDGARAYDRAARELHGEFAALNFPRPTERAA